MSEREKGVLIPYGSYDSCHFPRPREVFGAGSSSSSCSCEVDVSWDFPSDLM